jgi:hypothetical protein
MARCPLRPLLSLPTYVKPEGKARARVYTYDVFDSPDIKFLRSCRVGQKVSIEAVVVRNGVGIK